MNRRVQIISKLKKVTNPFCFNNLSTVCMKKVNLNDNRSNLIVNGFPLIICMILFSLENAHSQTFVPLPVSGFNHDLIAEGSGGINRAEATTTITFDGVNMGGDNVMYSTDFRGNTNPNNAPPFGLPVNRIINSINLPGANYLLAPYDQNNALVLKTNGSSGTLLLETPGVFSQIAFLGSSAEGVSNFNVILNFSDGTNTAFSFSVPDWYDGPNFAIQGIGRVSRTLIGTQNPDVFTGDATNPRLYDNQITLNAPFDTRILTSITFTKTSDGGSTAILAVNGITAINAPDAPVAVEGTNITDVSFASNWTSSSGATNYFLDVSTNSNFNSFVGLYNNFSVGNTLTQDISGLSSGTSYYFRVRAGNNSGISASSNTIEVNTTASACTITIPDANFKNYLIGNTDINTNEDDEIQCDEAVAYTGAIDCSSLGIASLTGIEALINISDLDCSSNQLNALDLSGNPLLNTLFCQGNQLTSLNVSGNPALTVLSTGGNQLTSLNVANNTKLTGLGCDVNDLMSLDVSNNPALTLLYAGNNAKMTTANLANGNNQIFGNIIFTNCPLLTCIKVDNAAYSIANWTGANFLFDPQQTFSEDCGADLDGEYCSNAIDIQTLFGHLLNEPQNSSTYNSEGYNGLNDPAFGQECLSDNNTIWFKFTGDGFRYSVRSNDCSTKIFTDPNGAMYSGDCADLTAIKCHRDISSSDENPDANFKIDVQTEVNKTYYLLVEVSSTDDFETYFKYGQFCLEVTKVDPECLVDIPDANFKNYLIENFSINTNGDGEIQCEEAEGYFNEINCAELDISDLKGIEAFPFISSLDCSSNLLNSIDLSKNTSLRTLNCSNNNLSAVSLANNVQLYAIDCHGNRLTALDVSHIEGLDELNCSDNLLTSLDISKNTILTSLWCNSNQLVYLNLANGINEDMNRIEANDNPYLTCVQVDDPVYSNENWTGGAFLFDSQHTFSDYCEPCVMTSNISANFLITSTACIGDQVRVIEYGVFDSIPGPVTFSWDFGDGTTSTERDPIVGYTAPGTYTISLQLGNTECPLSLEKDIDILSCLKDSKSNSYSRVSPNPSSGPIRIETQLPLESDISIKIFSIRGDEIYSHYYQSKATLQDEINITEPGIYIVEIRHLFGSERIKIFILN